MHDNVWNANLTVGCTTCSTYCFLSRLMFLAHNLVCAFMKLLISLPYHGHGNFSPFQWKKQNDKFMNTLVQKT